MLDDADTIDEMYGKFLNVIYTSIELYIPYGRTKRTKRLPNNILTILKEKHVLYNKSKRDKNFKLAYKQQANKYKAALYEYKRRSEEDVLKSKDKKVLYNFMKNR